MKEKESGGRDGGGIGKKKTNGIDQTRFNGLIGPLCPFTHFKQFLFRECAVLVWASNSEALSPPYGSHNTHFVHTRFSSSMGQNILETYINVSTINVRYSHCGVFRFLLVALSIGINQLWRYRRETLGYFKAGLNDTILLSYRFTFDTNHLLS